MTVKSMFDFKFSAAGRSQQHAHLVLTAYHGDAEIKRAHVLSPRRSTGFAGGVVQQSL